MMFGGLFGLSFGRNMPMGAYDGGYIHNKNTGGGGGGGGNVSQIISSGYIPLFLVERELVVLFAGAQCCGCIHRRVGASWDT